MVRLTTILGQATDSGLAEQLHRLGHNGRVEYLVLDRADTQRHRLRAETDQGTECANSGRFCRCRGARQDGAQHDHDQRERWQ